MATFRWRGDTCSAHIRKKKGGVIVYQEHRTFKGPRAELLARDWAQRREKTIAASGGAPSSSGITTLGGLLRLHKATLESIKPLTRYKESELNRLIEYFDKQPLSHLPPAVFTKYAQKRKKDGVSPNTTMHNLSTVRACLGTAKVMYGVDADAATIKEAMAALLKMKLIAPGTKRTRRPTASELSRLLEVFEAGAPYATIPMATILRLAIELPRRVGELTSMRWDDLRGNVVTLRDTKHPTAPRTEEVPVPPRAMEIIRTLPAIDEFILPYKSESVSSAFTKACRKAGIEDLHFHDLRREGISRLFEMGLNIPEVAKISGHLDWSMLKIYTEIKPESVLEKFA